MNTKTRFIAEVAMMAALALIFDYLASLFPLKLWANGGSISLAMLPIMLMGFRYGLKGGLLTGLIVGLIQISYGYIVHPVQMFLDYPIAYTAVGLTGLFPLYEGMSKSKMAVSVFLGSFIATFVRLLAHVISGIVWFGQFAPAGTPVALYSLVYNASFLLPGYLLSAILLWVLVQKAPRLMINKR